MISSSPDGWPQAAYVHIPFCRRRCYYCDFPVTVTGDRRHGGNFAPIPQYVAAVCQEIRQTLRPIVIPPGNPGQNPATPLSQGKPSGNPMAAIDRPPLTTVFLGGGTPSLLTPQQVDQILHTLDALGGGRSTWECSMEVDPGTFSLEEIQGYQRVGVNRYSLGVQAFEDDLLAACGRFHRRADIVRAVAMLGEAGAQNWSLDLIAGLPQQTLAQWEAGLHQAIALDPPHISLYDLTLEPGTVFGKRYQPGADPLPEESTTAQMYCRAHEILTAAGYDHYEVSNYSKPGYQCRHNRVYWQNQPYYGFGMGATSYVGGIRHSRPRRTQDYYHWLEQGAIVPPDLSADGDHDRLLDTLMLGLRLAEGLPLGRLQGEFGPQTIANLRSHCIPWIDLGWLELVPDPQGQEHLRLTQPQGFLFSNQVLAGLFARLGE